MAHIKFLLKAYPWAFAILLFALVTDLTNISDTATENYIFFLPTLAVCLYWLGIALLIRFKITKHRVHLGLTWLIMIPLWLIGFTALAFVTDGFASSGSTVPGAVFFLVMYWAYKTLRLEDPEQEQLP